MAERKKFLLRISPELYAELEKWAADEFRSVNAQIEFLLQRNVNERKRGRRSTISAPDTPRNSVDQGAEHP